MISPDGTPLSPIASARRYLAEPDVIYSRGEMREMVAGLLELASRHLPREASLGLLVSIAMRLDHGFGMRRVLPEESEEAFHRRQHVLLLDAARAYEEIAGTGFYRPDREHLYVVQVAAAVREQMEQEAKQS